MIKSFMIKQNILTRSLTHVGAPVEAAEGVVEAVHVRLAHAPAVRHPTCDKGSHWSLWASDWLTLT